ncbi:helix-turn-helix domain-containing protein [Microbacterium laevaniformans]|uniref:helix-turn-helix domain-containing protein n=1 Tax=Microbacterium laevaniformans TaxID=36807 RepID=UPI00077B22A9|nr:helix-turn-helix transcriptional regulator [Microbacterium laevaniformans]
MTAQKVADAIGCNKFRVKNMCQGMTYPSPDEIRALERLFGMPVDVMLEPALLIYRDGKVWPPHIGPASIHYEYELRARGVKVDPDPDFFSTQLPWLKLGGE